jgi:hypothetical protein
MNTLEARETAVRAERLLGYALDRPVDLRATAEVHRSNVRDVERRRELAPYRLMQAFAVP